MTDQQVIKLSEKTRKEKYCHNPCSDLCPIIDIVDCMHCEDKIYDIAFVDGFNIAFKYIEEIIKKSKIPNDGFGCSIIYNNAVDDIINKIKKFLI